MYEAIVVGTDGSDRAGIAVAQAIALAKMSGAKLHVVHAARPDAMAGTALDPAVVAVAEANRAYDHGDHICAQAITEAAREGVAAEMHSADGNPADVLVSIAESIEADLVVVGNRGMSGTMRFLLGSVSSKLSHHCPCSLLIVKTDAADT
jgi:nucleotide-binding universal stress UspA family protein